jgi:hypothetical protein
MCCRNGIASHLYFYVVQPYYAKATKGILRSFAKTAVPYEALAKYGAGNGTRTRDLCLGKATLYQLSYSRVIMSIFFNS